MHSIKNPYFLFALGVYLLLKVLSLYNVTMPVLISSYLADLLCMPIVLGLILGLIRWLKKQPAMTLPVSSVIFVWGYWSVYFELYLPYRNQIYTADFIDVIMYAVGTGAYLLWQHKQKLKMPLPERHKYYQ